MSAASVSTRWRSATGTPAWSSAWNVRLTIVFTMFVAEVPGGKSYVAGKR